MRRLGRLGVTLFLLGFMLFTDLKPASAQDNAALYGAERKNEVIAALAGLAVPILGTMYAGDTQRGLAPTLVQGGGFVLMIAGSGYPPNASLLMLGVLAELGGSIWGGIVSYQTAQDYNSDLRQRLGIQLGFAPGIEPGSVGIGLKISL